MVWQDWARATIVVALAVAGLSGAVRQTIGAELFPYNPPVILPQQQQSRSGEGQSFSRAPGTSVPPQFYETFGAKARSLRPEEQTKLRDSLYGELNRAVRSGNLARAEYYSNLIKAAGF